MEEGDSKGAGLFRDDGAASLSVMQVVLKSNTLCVVFSTRGEIHPDLEEGDVDNCVRCEENRSKACSDSVLKGIHSFKIAILEISKCFIGGLQIIV